MTYTGTKTDAIKIYIEHTLDIYLNYYFDSHYFNHESMAEVIAVKIEQLTNGSGSLEEWEWDKCNDTVFISFSQTPYFISINLNNGHIAFCWHDLKQYRYLGTLLTLTEDEINIIRKKKMGADAKLVSIAKITPDWAKNVVSELNSSVSAAKKGKATIHDILRIADWRYCDIAHYYSLNHYSGIKIDLDIGSVHLKYQSGATVPVMANLLPMGQLEDLRNEFAWQKELVEKNKGKQLNFVAVPIKTKITKQDIEKENQLAAEKYGSDKQVNFVDMVDNPKIKKINKVMKTNNEIKDANFDKSIDFVIKQLSKSTCDGADGWKLSFDNKKEIIEFKNIRIRALYAFKTNSSYYIEISLNGAHHEIGSINREKEPKEFETIARFSEKFVHNEIVKNFNSISNEENCHNETKSPPNSGDEKNNLYGIEI